MEVTSLPPVTSPAPLPGSSGGAQGQLKNREEVGGAWKSRAGGSPAGGPKTALALWAVPEMFEQPFKFIVRLGTRKSKDQM